MNTKDLTWQLKSNLDPKDVEVLQGTIERYATRSPAIVTNETSLAIDLGIDNDDVPEMVFALERHKEQELYDYSLEPKTVGNLIDVIEVLEFLRATDDG